MITSISCPRINWSLSFMFMKIIYWFNFFFLTRKHVYHTCETSNNGKILEKKENILVWHCAHLQILWPNVCWHFPAGTAQDAASRRHRHRYMPTLTNTTFLGLKLNNTVGLLFCQKNTQSYSKSYYLVSFALPSHYRHVTVTILIWTRPPPLQTVT